MHSTWSWCLICVLQKEDNRVGPSMESIKKATENVHSQNMDRKPTEDIANIDVRE